MKEEILSIVTHALAGVDVSKETVDLIVNQCLEKSKESFKDGAIAALGNENFDMQKELESYGF